MSAPLPSAIRRVRDTRGRKPAASVLREPQPKLLEKDKPTEWLDPKAKKYFAEIVPMLREIKVSTEVDITALNAMCVTYAVWRDAYEFIKKHGFTYEHTDARGNSVIRQYPEVSIEAEANLRLRRWLVEFGLTPSSRTKVNMVDDPKEKGEEFQF